MRLQLQGQTARLAGPGFISSVPLHLKKTGGKCCQSQPVEMLFSHYIKLYCAERTDLITKMSFYREVGRYLEGKYINITRNIFTCREC